MSIERKARLQKLYDELRETTRKYDRIEDRLIDMFKDDTKWRRVEVNIYEAMYRMSYAMDLINSELNSIKE